MREWCLNVAREKRKAFQDDVYWGLPVPNFGDPQADGLIIGLAPAAHGANRTGRMFTGDRSGDWLYRALHEAGLANIPTSTEAQDGLELKGVLITAVCHCAPPDNKPARIEIENCRVHLADTFALRPYRAYLCLGKLAWDETMRQLGAKGTFGHGARLALEDGREVFGSYHPSQQNTFTGKLTRDMFQSVIGAFAAAVQAASS